MQKLYSKSIIYFFVMFLFSIVGMEVSAKTCAKKKTWQSSADWSQGTKRGITIKGGLALTHCDKSISPPTTNSMIAAMYVPNSNTNTLVKINTRTGSIIWTFNFTPLNVGNSPSRMAVDSKGNIWVGLRYGQHIVVLSPKAKVLAKIYIGETPRSLVLGKDGNIWAGAFNARLLVRISSTNYKITHRYQGNSKTLCPYGASSDGKGNIWIVSRCGTKNDRLIKFSEADAKPKLSIVLPFVYAAVPRGAEIWATSSINNKAFGKLYKINATTGEILKTLPLQQCRARGITLDKQGQLWIACSHVRMASRPYPGTSKIKKVYRYQPNTKHLQTFSSGPDLIGMATDYDGFIWGMSHTGGRLYKHKTDGTLVGSYPACDLSGKKKCHSKDGSGCGVCKVLPDGRLNVTPYAYSNMASHILDPDGTIGSPSIQECSSNLGWVKKTKGMDSIVKGKGHQLLLLPKYEKVVTVIDTCNQKVLWEKNYSQNVQLDIPLTDDQGNYYFKGYVGLTPSASPSFDGVPLVKSSRFMAKYSPTGKRLFFKNRITNLDFHLLREGKRSPLVSIHRYKHIVTQFSTGNPHQTWSKTLQIKLTAFPGEIWRQDRFYIDTKVHTIPNSQSFLITGAFRGKKITIEGKTSPDSHHQDPSRQFYTQKFLIKMKPDGSCEWIVFLENIAKNSFIVHSQGNIYWGFSAFPRPDRQGNKRQLRINGVAPSSYSYINLLEISPQGVPGKLIGTFDRDLLVFPQLLELKTGASGHIYMHILFNPIRTTSVSVGFGSLRTIRKKNSNGFLVRIDPLKKDAAELTLFPEVGGSTMRQSLQIDHFENIFITNLNYLGSAVTRKIARASSLPKPTPTNKGTWQTYFNAGCKADWKSINLHTRISSTGTVKVRVRTAPSKKDLIIAYWSKWITASTALQRSTGQWLELEAKLEAITCAPMTRLNDLDVHYAQTCQCQQPPSGLTKAPKGFIAKQEIAITLPSQHNPPTIRSKPSNNPFSRIPVSNGTDDPPPRPEPFGSNHPSKGCGCSVSKDSGELPVFPILGLFLLFISLRRKQ